MTDESPASLRELSREAYAAAKAAIKAGDVKLARELSKLAVHLAADAEGVDSRSPGVQDSRVTAAQAEKNRRGHAVARAVAPNDLFRAIVDDPLQRWRSGADYARRRLRIAPASLTHYCGGVSPCPAEVDRKVREDFPALFLGKNPWVWKKGVTP